MIGEAVKVARIATGEETEAFEILDDGARQFLAGDDDSGHETNAKVELRMIKGRRHVIRLRLFFSWDQGNMAIMIT